VKAADFAPMIIGWHNGAPVRLSDVASVVDGPEDNRTMGLFNGKKSVSIIITRQPGANIVETVDALKDQIGPLQAQLPGDIKLNLAMDRTTTIRASLHEVEITLLISTLLVVIVVSLFLQSWRATLIPASAVIVSLLGTLGVMYLSGFLLDNLSLMALTVATGFVVDDAIVVVENIARHVEDGMKPFQAALKGAREVGFTVLSISLSLVAVFVPLIFMQGLVGRPVPRICPDHDGGGGDQPDRLADADADAGLAPAGDARPRAWQSGGQCRFRATRRFFDWLQGRYAKGSTGRCIIAGRCCSAFWARSSSTSS
jgi:multidrug efflux pump